jgi:hypothetical protein
MTELLWEDTEGVELSDEDIAEILGEREYDREKGN